MRKPKKDILQKNKRPKKKKREKISELRVPKTLFISQEDRC